MRFGMPEPKNSVVYICSCKSVWHMSSPQISFFSAFPDKGILIKEFLLLVSFWFDDVLLVSKAQEEGRDLLQQQQQVRRARATVKASKEYGIQRPSQGRSRTNRRRPQSNANTLAQMHFFTCVYCWWWIKSMSFAFFEGFWLNFFQCSIKN